MKERNEIQQLRQFVAAAGSVGVAQEIIAAAGEIFGEYMVGKPRVISEPIGARDADIFLCFASRIPELAQKIPVDRIIGINMVPTHHFCLQLNTIPAQETRWVFCNSHNSAQVIIDYCEQFGLNIDNFHFATYDDTPEEELLAILRQARCIVGVYPMVGPGGVLLSRYGKYLAADCRIIEVKRVLSPESIATIYRWVLNLTRELERNIQAKNASLEKAMRKMKRIQKQLEHESAHDSLTGCYNRKTFEEALDRIDGQKHGFVALIMMDMDGLKDINDAYGHSEGDAVLTKVGKLLRGCFRKKDIVARIGGDEFAAVLLDAKESTLHEIVDRVREKFNAWSKEETRYRTNMSLGFSYTIPGQKNAMELYKEADAAMYREKMRHKSATAVER